MSRLTTVLATVLMCTLVAMGCASGGGTPVTPTTDNNLTVQTSNHGTQTNLWGLFDVYIDIQARKAEAVMNRSCMYTANVVTFLNNPATNLGFNIIGTPTDPAFIDVDIDVSLTHPFPGLTQYNGYDVRGVFIGDASAVLNYNTDLMYAAYGVTDQVMFDYNLTDPDTHVGLFGMPDGYTRWWNPTEFTTTMEVLGYTQGAYGTPPPYTPTGTLNPYKYFADGLGVEDDLWSWLNVPENAANNGVFSAGTTNTRNYYLRFPSETAVVNYEYAVCANWEAEDIHPSNASEAIAVATDITPDIYFVDGTNKGGDFIADISVFNWSTVMMESASIWLESTVLSAPYQFNPTEMTPTGGGDNFSTFSVDILADNITGTGGNEYWIIVEQPGRDYTNEFGVPNLADTDTLAAFFRYYLYVSPNPYCQTGFVSISPNEAMKGSTVNDELITCTELEAGPNLGVKLTKTGQSDIDGTDVQLTSATTMTADFSLVGAAAGFWNVVVTNGCGGTPGVGANAFEVISEKPTACAEWSVPGNPQGPVPCDIVEFDASCSTDDGMIVLYEWDFDGDGTFEFSIESPIAEHTYEAPGEYAVDLRVTDDDGLTDTLDAPLLVVVENALPTAVAEASKYTAFVGETIDFNGSGSHDNDCEGQEITLWEWDWENDGIYDETGGYVPHVYMAPGIYEVQLRVTDDEGETDTLDQPLEVTIEPVKMPHAWTKTWGGSENEGYCVAADGSGNAYVTGYFSGTVDFDPGSGVDSHTATALWDVFLSKFDPSGTFLWAKTWGGNSWQRGRSVDTDASGNVYVTGTYRIDIIGSFDMFAFLRKFDSSGNQLWERTWGGTNKYNEGWSIVVDASGFAYVTGDFEGTVDFNPGAGVENHTANGSLDAFLSKFDSSGTFLWARTWGGSVDDHGRSVAVDGSANAYVTGQFQASVDFNPGAGVDNHTSNGSYDAFLSKFDSSGNFSWAKTWGGSNAEDGLGVAVDSSGSAYATGFFQGIVDFDPGSGIDEHTSNGYNDVFLSKFDSSGNFLWAKTWGGSSTDGSYGVAVDSSGSVYVAGEFRETVDFDPGSGVDNHTANGSCDIFLSNFDSSGNFLWAKAWGGTDWDEGYGVAADGSGNAYVTGYFGMAVDFDPGPGEDLHISKGGYNAFLSKFVP